MLSGIHTLCNCVSVISKVKMQKLENKFIHCISLMHAGIAQVYLVPMRTWVPVDKIIYLWKVS